MQLLSRPRVLRTRNRTCTGLYFYELPEPYRWVSLVLRSSTSLMEPNRWALFSFLYARRKEITAVVRVVLLQSIWKVMRITRSHTSEHEFPFWDPLLLATPIILPHFITLDSVIRGSYSRYNNSQKWND